MNQVLNDVVAATRLCVAGYAVPAQQQVCDSAIKLACSTCFSLRSAVQTFDVPMSISYNLYTFVISNFKSQASH